MRAMLATRTARRLRSISHHLQRICQSGRNLRAFSTVNLEHRQAKATEVLADEANAALVLTVRIRVSISVADRCSPHTAGAAPSSTMQRVCCCSGHRSTTCRASFRRSAAILLRLRPRYSKCLSRSPLPRSIFDSLLGLRVGSLQDFIGIAKHSRLCSFARPDARCDGMIEFAFSEPLCAQRPYAPAC